MSALSNPKRTTKRKPAKKKAVISGASIHIGGTTRERCTVGLLAVFALFIIVLALLIPWCRSEKPCCPAATPTPVVRLTSTSTPSPTATPAATATTTSVPAVIAVPETGDGSFSEDAINKTVIAYATQSAN